MKSIFKDKDGNLLEWGEAAAKILNRFLNYALDFELMLLRWVGHVPSHIARKIFYQVSGVKMGKNSTIHMWANFFDPRNIEIGEGSIVGDHAFLDGREKIKIGSNTDIASSVMIFNSEHNLESKTFKARNEPVGIGDNVFIGPRVTIMPGVNIGNGAVVAGGAVVTKNVSEYCIVGGVPARVIGERKNKNLNYKLGRARLFQ